MALADSGDELYGPIREILMPLAAAALSGGASWFAARRKNRAEAEKADAEADAIGGDLFQRQVKLLADLWAAQNEDLRAELDRLRVRNDNLEQEINALRKSLDDRRTDDPIRRTVAFVPPCDEGENP